MSHEQHPEQHPEHPIDRRDFVALSAAVGMAAFVAPGALGAGAAAFGAAAAAGGAGSRLHPAATSTAIHADNTHTRAGSTRRTGIRGGTGMDEGTKRRRKTDFFRARPAEGQRFRSAP